MGRGMGAGVLVCLFVFVGWLDGLSAAVGL